MGVGKRQGLRVSKKGKAPAQGRGTHKSSFGVEKSGQDMKELQAFYYFLSIQNTDSMEVINIDRAMCFDYGTARPFPVALTNYRQ